MNEVIITGFLLGLISSFHCVGMCGPLALALPVYHLAPVQKSIAVLLYHAGRIVTYTAFGVLFGFAGRRFHIAGIQQWVSISAGVVISILLAGYFLEKRRTYPSWMNSYYRIIHSLLQRFLHIRSAAGFFLVGIGNGLLPCGMVYLAIAGALNTNGVSQGAYFMFAFGIGTVPAMLLLSFFQFRISISVRTSMKKAIPYFMAGMAILLVLRGLNLDIPFVSPAINTAVPEAVSCH